MITVLFGLVAAYELGAGVTPVQKVIQMMQEMSAKGKQEKHEETVRFAAFSQFCKDTMDQKQTAIANAADAIEQLQADIQKAQADQERLGSEISVLDGNIGAWEADKQKAEEDRAEAKAEFDLLHKDYTESIDALGRAVSTLQREDKDSAQALLQVSSLHRMPSPAKRTIMAFLQSKEEREDPLSVSAPQADAYVFQSGGIVEMLEKLEDKFKAELDGYQKEDMQAKHASTMLIQQLVDNIAAATEERDRKTIEKTKRAEAEGTATGDLATTKTDKAADEAYLKDLRVECDQKSRDYESRQTLRAEELEAIAKATEIISSGAVSGNSEKHLPQFVQTSFGLRSARSRSPLVAKVATFLLERAAKTKSHLLALVATKVQADPFANVKKMIKAMIVKLMEEATEESEHKGWCDTELGMNKQTRDTKSDAVSTLTASAEELSAQIAKLGNEVAELSDGIASIDTAVAEATSLRQEEKAKNEETIVDSQEAQVAVAKALTVLKDFYAKADDATAFMQGAADDAPATFDGAYKGMGSSSGGVIGMLEVIESDFARLEADTTTAESEAANEFQKFSDDSSQDKAVKQMDLDNKGKDKTTAEGDLVTTKKDLSATQEELDAALTYFEKLKPACVDAGLSY